MSLTNAFQQMDQEIESTIKDSGCSGSTCSIFLTHDCQITTANVGDSRSILCSLINNEIQAKQLTKDHKPSDPIEASRIIKAGGRIEAYKGFLQLFY